MSYGWAEKQWPTARTNYITKREQTSYGETSSKCFLWAPAWHFHEKVMTFSVSKQRVNWRILVMRIFFNFSEPPLRRQNVDPIHGRLLSINQQQSQKIINWHIDCEIPDLLRIYFSWFESKINHFSGRKYFFSFILAFSDFLLIDFARQ